MKNRSNLRPRWRPQGADLPPRTPQGGCGRCHPTLRHSKRRKPTKIGFAQATPPGLPLSERLIYHRRQPGHLIGRFVRSRGVPETRARDYRESGAASKTRLRRQLRIWTVRVTRDAGGKKRSPLLLVNKCHLTLGEALAGCPLPRPSLL